MPRLPGSSQAVTTKIPYKCWSPSPCDEEMDHRWARVSHYAYCLGKELHHRQWSNGTRPPHLRIDPDGWEESLCRTMQVRGPDRRNAKKVLRSLRAAGLLEVRDGFARVLMTPDEVSDRVPLGSLSAPSPHPLGSLIDSSVENDSLHVPQIRIEKIRSEERESARERAPVQFADPEQPSARAIGNDFMFNAGLRVTPVDRPELLEFIGVQPEAERDAALRALAADTWVRKHKPNVEHVVRFWDRYCAAAATPARSELQEAEEAMRARETEWKKLRGEPPQSPEKKIALQAWLASCERVKRLRGEVVAA